LKLLRLEEGWNTAVLLLGALLVAAWTLVATEWAEGLQVLPVAAAGGLAAGLFLGWSVFQDRICHLFSAIYGLTWVGFLLGRGLPGDLTWGERITDLAARFFYWAHQAVTGGKGRDTLIFVMLLSALFWILGYSAAWHTFRRMRAWRAILPPGIVVLVSVYYYVGPAPMMRYLALYLFFALLYVARSHAFEQEEKWRRERMVFDPALRVDFLRASLVLILVVLVLAWTLPAAAAVPRLTATWRRVSDPWRAVQEEWKRLFSGLQGYAVARVEPFGPSLTLGGPRNVRDVVVMDVSAPREGRYYWRAAGYAYYRGDRWEAVEKERILLIPGRQVPGMARDALRHPVDQTVTSYAPGHRVLVGASQPVAVDREAEATIDRSEDAPLEFIRIYGILPLEADDQYVVTSQVSHADATSLRQAGTDYPDWVSQRYLQLPAALPDRVRLLAEEITVSADNPSWPEVYFPGYGWIEFEPTASEPPLIRPARPDDEAASEDHVPRGAGREDMGSPYDDGRLGPGLDDELDWDIEPLAKRRGPLVWVSAVGLTLVALVVGGWWAAENWGLRGLPAVERAYARLLRFGRWLGRPLRVSDTPLEWVDDLSAAVPEAQEPIGRIVELYVHTRFARGTAADPEARAAWRQARPVLWRRWLRRFVPF